MRERLVGLGHLVRLFYATDRAACVVHRIHELAGETVGHRFARTLARRLDEPAHRERRATVRSDLDWDLIGRATDAARLYLDERHRVLQRELEDLDARLARGRLGLREGAVDDPFSGRALAALHEVVVELRKQNVAVLAVRNGLAFLWSCSSWHLGRLPLLGVRVLRAVEAATALAVLDPSGVERPADDVVLHRRQVRHRAALDEDDGVLLEVVSDAGDVGGDLHPIGQADTCDLSQRRVRLLRGHRPDDRADTALLGRATTELGVATFERVPGRAQGRCIHLLLLRLAPA